MDINFDIGVRMKVHKRVSEDKKYYKMIYKANKNLYKKFGNQFLWHKAYFKDMKTPVKVCCKSHGFFWETPQNMLNSKFTNCPVCKKLYDDNTYRYQGKLYNRTTFLTQCIKTNGDKFDYTDTIFNGFNRIIKVRCHTHGLIKVQKPHTHLTEAMCPICKGQIPKVTTKKFIEKAKLVHGDQYTYEQAEYTACTDPIDVTCRIHGVFTIPRAMDHYYKNGTGCPKCATSGFNPNLPGTVYYVSVFNGMAYKIGITNNTVERRFGSEMKNIQVLKTWYFENGEGAREMEKDILTKFKEYKYTATNLLAAGNTELFYRDILDLDKSLQ